MDALILDTSVASLTLIPFRKREFAIGTRYKSYIRDKRLVISFQTVAELLAWPEANRWGSQKRDKLHQLLDELVIVPYSFELAQTWASVSTLCKRQGRRLEAGDAWVVATAVHHKLRLVTHDRDQLGLDISGLEVFTYLE